MIKILNIIIWIISIISVLSFIVITFLRIYTAKNQAKRYGMRKEITDPISYWISYTSAILIVILKIVQVIFNINLGNGFVQILFNLLPSVALLIFTRTIGRSAILRAEKMIYLNHLITETKDVNKFVKKDSGWTLITSTGEYPVSLTNTTVLKIADITGASIENKD